MNINDIELSDLIRFFLFGMDNKNIDLPRIVRMNQAVVEYDDIFKVRKNILAATKDNPDLKYFYDFWKQHLARLKESEDKCNKHTEHGAGE